MGFVHLHNHSCFSFLDGVPKVETLVRRAAELNMNAVALTDHNNVSGAVRFHRAATSAGIKPIQGAEVTLQNGCHLTLLARNSAGYASLCRIITRAHLNCNGPIDRKNPQASWNAVAENAENLICLSGCRKGEVPRLLLRGQLKEAKMAALRMRDAFGRGNFYLEMQNNALPLTKRLNRLLAQLAEHIGVGVVATNNCHYLTPDEFPVHDTLTCVRTLTTLEQIHPDRPLNARNYMLSPQEMARAFRDYPKALLNTGLIAEQCEPAIDFQARLFPHFTAPNSESAFSYLYKLAFAGARERYGRVTDEIRARLMHELDIIRRLDLQEYFLVVWDVAQFAKRRGIRHSGRGSAADSAVAYCLGLTDVDSIRRGLLFERFLSLERAQKPDIDIDFDSRYRDDVTRYVYQKYGADNVATVCTFNTFHIRSAIRDVGKAMGFPEPEIDRLAKRFPVMYPGCPVWTGDIGEALSNVPELRDSDIPFQRYKSLFEICAKVDGNPRFIGTHLGGVVISRQPLTNVTPLQMAAKGMVVTQFDKDDIEELGLIKLDLLCLRMLSAVDDSVNAINAGCKDGSQRLNYPAIPLDDKETYELLRSGQTVGAFQLESPAQRALQGRLGADNIEDVIASVALIRPGPIEGNMVEPFIRRRTGVEAVTYLHPKLEPILRKTYGVVLYQEQVIEIATVIAGFTPGEADKLRRAMTHARRRQDMDEIGKQFVRKAVERGVDLEVAKTIFSYIVGYAGYGFCEAHAAAFGHTAYRTAYLLRHHPAEFYAAILSNQPMGYYSPNTICLEARRRGITVLPPNINRSAKEFTVEDGCIRVSLSQVRGMSKPALEAILCAREEGGPFRSLLDFCRRVGISSNIRQPVDRDILENLVLCGAFDELHPNRRQLFWRLEEIRRQAQVEDSPLFKHTGRQQAVFGADKAHLFTDSLQDFSDFEKFALECQVLGINVTCHCMAYYRDALREMGAITSGELLQMRANQKVRIGGLLINPHRPPTKSGKVVVFLSLEDETGLADVTVFEDVYQKYGNLIYSRPALIVEGVVDRRGKHPSVIAERMADLSPKYRRADTQRERAVVAMVR